MRTPTTRAATLALLASAAAPLALAPTASAQNAPFESAVRAEGPSHRFEAVLDYDGDGDPDVAGWFFEGIFGGQIDLKLYANDGTGALTESATGFLGAAFFPITYDEPTRSVVANFDEEPGEEIALSFEGTLLVARPTTTVGGVGSSLLLSTTPDILGLATSDIDLDGDQDLMVVRTDILQLFANAGDATGWTSVAEIPAPAGALGAEAVQVDGVGAVDLAVLTATDLRLIAITGGTFGVSQTFAHTLPAPELVAGDIDGDGDTDLVAFGSDGTYAVLRNALGTWLLEPTAIGGPATDLVDVDLDGDLDGVRCGVPFQGLPAQTNVADSPYEISLNDGTGAFALPFELPGLGAHRFAGAADLDFDGDPDLVAGRTVLYNPGGIEPPRTAGLPGGLEGPAWQVVGDQDADGDLDYEVGLGTTLRTVGDGTLHTGPVSPLPTPPAGTVFEGPGFPGDFDGDGDQDLVVSLKDDTSGAFLSMRLLESRGGAWLDAGDAAAPGVNFNIPIDGLGTLQDEDDPRLAVAMDGDGDGDLDLAVNRPGETPSASNIWWNDGTGFFASSTALPFTEVQWMGDINGDSVPDLILNWGAGILRRAFGNGNQTFGPSTIIQGAPLILPHRDRVAIADVDANGAPDIVGIHPGDGSIQVLWNDGAGNYFGGLLGQTGFDPSPNPADPGLLTYALDVNDDDLLDLLFLREPGVQLQPSDDPVDYVATMLQLPGNGWAPLIRQIASHTAVADVDLDGDPDLLGQEIVMGTQWVANPNGRKVQYGAGNPGTGGIIPILGLQGAVYDGSFPTMVIRGGAGGGIPFLAASLADASLPFLPDATLLVDLTPGIQLFIITFPPQGLAGEAGTGGFDFFYAVGPGMVGLDVYHQGAVLDPGAAFGATVTNGLLLEYGAGN